MTQKIGMIVMVCVPYVGLACCLFGVLPRLLGLCKFS